MKNHNEKISGEIHNERIEFMPKSKLSSLIGNMVIGGLLSSGLTSVVLAQPSGNNAQDNPSAEAEETVSLESIVVRARNREEKLQEVPIPVSAVTGKELDRDQAINISDFAKRTTNVQAAELNSRRSSVSIRGVGKNVNGEEFEAPVGVIIDNVFQPYVGASWANFPDLESIEVYRGPQGTLLGKNTTLGVLNITSRQPSFTPDYSLEASIGSRDHKRVAGYATGPIKEGVLAYRLSFYDETGDGSIKARGADGRVGQNATTWYDRNRSGARLQFLANPTRDLTARVILHYARAKENINMSPQVADPATYFDGTPRAVTATTRYARDWFGGYQQLHQNFVVDANYLTPSTDEQNGVSAELNWDLGHHTLTSISAYKDNLFRADNDFDNARWEIRQGGGAWTNQRQFSEELRLTSTKEGPIDYQVGAYALLNKFNNSTHSIYGQDAGAFYATNPQYAALNTSAAGRELLRASLNNFYTIQKTSPETTSFALFGQLNYRFTEKATLTAGIRQTYEKKENSFYYYLNNPGNNLEALAAQSGASAEQLAAAQAIRNTYAGSSSKFGPTRHVSDSSNSTSLLLSPSYKLDGNTLLYASVARGVKSGAVSWNSNNGTPNVTKPEVAIDFELGAKFTLLERRLNLNVNLYNTDITDFQTNQVIPDDTVLGGYRTVIGNAEKVQLRGLEIDGTYLASRALSFRFGGAISSAKYDDYKDAPTPGDLSATVAPFSDYSGKTLPGAPKYSLNLGVEYRQPIGYGLLFDAHANNTYTSRQNVALNLSEAGWEPARNIVDIGFGIGADSGAWRLSLLVKNAFDKVYSVDTNSFTGSSGISKRWGERRTLRLNYRVNF